jgi:hypothetical protein
LVEIVTGDNYDNGQKGREGNWMQTYTGRQFWPMDPRPEEVHLEDMAHGLANACRFAGHCLRFYSVAEHSILMSRIVRPELALTALLHDATEAYVVDVPRPLKPFLPGYKDIEHKVWLAIAARYGLPEDLPDEIKEADNAMLLAEQAQNMAPPPAPWCIPGEIAPVVLPFWSPAQAEVEFLARFHELSA